MKYTIVYLFIFCSFSLRAQVSRFRAEKSAVGFMTGKENITDKLKWVDDDALIVLNHNNKTIKVYGHKTLVFPWFKVNFTDSSKLQEGMKGRAVYDTVDPYGEECHIQFDIYKSKSVGYDAYIYLRYRYNVLTYVANIVK
jgi:hypothetical protein